MIIKTYERGINMSTRDASASALRRLPLWREWFLPERTIAFPLRSARIAAERFRSARPLRRERTVAACLAIERFRAARALRRKRAIAARPLAARVAAISIERRALALRLFASCNPQIHRPSAEARARELLDHIIAILRRNRNVRDVIADVDRSDLAAGDAGFVGDRADDVSGADSIVLADGHGEANLR